MVDEFDELRAGLRVYGFELQGARRESKDRAGRFTAFNGEGVELFGSSPERLLVRAHRHVADVARLERAPAPEAVGVQAGVKGAGPSNG